MANKVSSLVHTGRFRIGLNVSAQIVIVAIIVLMINYLGFTRYKRWDLSRDNKFALSELTKKALRSLKKSVHIYVFFSPTSQSPSSAIAGDVQNLLREYEFAGGRKLEVETINPYRDITRARELQLKYNFEARENSVVIDYQGRAKVVRVADMLDYGSPGMFDESPQIRAFRGEQVITSALLELIEDKAPRIAFVTGHGEPDVESESFSSFRDYVERQNIRLETLSLSGIDKIPAALSVVVLLGPRYDLSDREIALLQAYWNDHGRVLILLDPKYKTPRLKQFLEQHGITVDDDLIISQLPAGIEGPKQTLDVYTQFLPETPFLRSLSQATGFFPGGTSSIQLDSRKTSEIGVSGTKSLTPAVSDYWGKKGDLDKEDATYKQGVDLPPPLAFGVALEKGSVADVRLDVGSSSRMFVLGNADFLGNECLTRSPQDVDFILITLNWLAGRERMVAIAPKVLRTFTLNLSDTQMDKIVLLTVVAMPLLMALLGASAWMLRRR
ncbi:MAG: GldG family protein [Verrucomicrobia bacterium]|nr:GldG family protein [Verrucomicrobiota bacterium]MBV9674378.1 GldG family protein [Verrucomicrobiota bacterium]